jgi:hypothetical protein
MVNVHKGTAMTGPAKSAGHMEARKGKAARCPAIAGQLPASVNGERLVTSARTVKRRISYLLVRGQD